MANNRFNRASQIAAQSFRNSVVPVTAAFDPYEAWQAYQKAAEKAQTADEFKAAVKAEYPSYKRDQYLDMTAAGFFPANDQF